jgi:hypothetical protein
MFVFSSRAAWWGFEPEIGRGKGVIQPETIGLDDTGLDIRVSGRFRGLLDRFDFLDCENHEGEANTRPPLGILNHRWIKDLRGSYPRLSRAEKLRVDMRLNHLRQRQATHKYSNERALSGFNIHFFGSMHFITFSFILGDRWLAIMILLCDWNGMSASMSVVIMMRWGYRGRDIQYECGCPAEYCGDSFGTSHRSRRAGPDVIL